MKALLSLILFALCIQSLFAQKETNNWFYGLNLGHTFVNGNPQPLSGIPSGPFNGSTSYSDPNGNLKFIFNGNAVYDRNYNIMRGVNLYPSGNGNAVTVAMPANPNLFYGFYFSGTVGNHPLMYLLVDMSLNGGLGQVITANNQIETNISNYTLVQKKGTNDLWIVTHIQYTDIYHSWLVTAAGINSTPVTSHAGLHADKTDYTFVDFRASPNGEMIAGTTTNYDKHPFTYYVHFTEVFNFDDQTGIITNRVKSTEDLRTDAISSYLEFSPDNRLLYVNKSYIDYFQTCFPASSHIKQYNLCYTDSTSFNRYAPIIQDTFAACNKQQAWEDMRLAPNKKIYMNYRFVKALSVINAPNIIGNHCNFNFNALALSADYAIGQPSFYQGYMQKAVINNIVYKGGCYPNPLHFKISNDTINQVDWNFGDAGSGGNNTATNKTEDHAFSAPGYYTVTAKLYASDGRLIETVSTLVEIKDPAKRLLYGDPKDTTICQSNSLKLKLDVVNGVFAWYTKVNGTWDFSKLSDSFTITTPGEYMVEMVQNACNGCNLKDSINVTVVPPTAFSLGADTYICAGDSLQLTANVPNASFLWNTNDITNAIYAKKAGLYWVNITEQSGCTSSHDIYISQKALPRFTLGNDTTLCEQQQLTYNFNLPSASYTWNTGSTQAQQVITQPGLYWLQVNQQGCSKRDSVTVAYNPIPPVNLGNDTTLCEGVTYQLNANAPANATYTWQNNSTAPSFTVNRAGKYRVQASLNGCTNADTVNITYILKPAFDLGNDTIICNEHTLTLQPAIKGPATYQWQNGSTSPFFTVSKPGAYAVTVSNECGTKSDTINVKQGLCLLILPNAFSPNHDGVNDVFRIKSPWFVKEFHMMIFNRWGQMVFESRDPYKGWDGNFNGAPQPNGGYVWVISLTDKDGQKDSSRGSVVLIR